MVQEEGAAEEEDVDDEFDMEDDDYYQGENYGAPAHSMFAHTMPKSLLGVRLLRRAGCIWGCNWKYMCAECENILCQGHSLLLFPGI